MENVENEVVSRIRRIIDNKGLKQKHVAYLCGYTENQFSNMLNGRKKIDTVDLYKISIGLKTTPNELMGIRNKSA